MRWFVERKACMCRGERAICCERRLAVGGVRLDPPPCYVKVQSGRPSVLAWAVRSTSHEESAQCTQ